MKGSTAARELALVVVCTIVLAGCAQRYYYTKTNATYSAFTTDHVGCVKEVGLVKGEQAYIAAGPYRGCMQLRGWTRKERVEPVGPEWFRGIEEDGVASIYAPPPTRTSEPVSAAYREHCRQIHLMRSDWQHRLPEYRACLER